MLPPRPHHTDLNITNPTPPPRPQIEVHVEVFSIGSSTEVKTVGEMGDEMNIATIGCSGPGGDVICEKGLCQVDHMFVKLGQDNIML